ncbi:MAG TPA: DNA repair protein RadA, partial [Firmicutes bacterium]|nr:DNA repair protein RadA [Bacillota bacterium]
MSRGNTVFICRECGYVSPRWMGRCSGCGVWNAFIEEKPAPRGMEAPERRNRQEGPASIQDIISETEERLVTGIGEFDRVLGGGLMPASVVLLGGNPGIGKSTLLLQVAAGLARRKIKVLYISGEESLRQIKLRAVRLNSLQQQLLVAAETELAYIEALIEKAAPAVVVIDSIQTVYDSSLPAAPGSISQVRDCTAFLTRLAKEKAISFFIVGHVTKEGLIAGPKILEHMVDCVLSFEGESHHSYRILRTIKNRFGASHEIGVFTMQEEGLAEVKNPSEFFVTRRPVGAAGSVVVASMEGTRPLLVEVQSLVSPTRFSAPRQKVTGLDANRVALIMAVLEKKAGLLFQDHDAFVKITGGVHLQEPAVDLGLALSLASAFKNRPVGSRDIFIGEV